MFYTLNFLQLNTALIGEWREMQSQTLVAWTVPSFDERFKRRVERDAKANFGGLDCSEF